MQQSFRARKKYERKKGKLCSAKERVGIMKMIADPHRRPTDNILISERIKIPPKVFSLAWKIVACYLWKLFA